MIGDPELLAFRRDYYGLLTALVGAEVSPALLERLASGLSERVEPARRLHPALGEGWEAIGAYLSGRPVPEAAEAARDEFTRLFIGPFEAAVHPYESFYLTGHIFDRPLAVVRSFLAEIGLGKEPSHPEPEDWLAFELATMAELIDRQARAGDPDGEARWVNAQAVLLKRHLLVWAPKCAEDLEAAPAARFYRGVAQLLRGFLELERELFRDWGAEPVRTLEEARAAASALGAWRGPLMDLPARREEPPDAPSEPAPGGPARDG